MREAIRSEMENKYLVYYKLLQPESKDAIEGNEEITGQELAEFGVEGLKRRLVGKWRGISLENAVIVNIMRL